MSRLLDFLLYIPAEIVFRLNRRGTRQHTLQAGRFPSR